MHEFECGEMSSHVDGAGCVKLVVQGHIGVGIFPLGGWSCEGESEGRKAGD